MYSTNNLTMQRICIFVMIYARVTLGSSALLHCSENVNFINITLKWAVIVTSQGQGLHSSALLPLEDNMLQRQCTP